MIRLPETTLDDDTSQHLADCQSEVNAERAYAKRVERAKELWEKYPKNRAFEPVKRALGEMCCGARRCVYCEDSVADEIEHVRPKDLFPEHVFSWPNYVYACGPCNGPKNNNFAVFPPRARTPVAIARGPDDPVKRPITGAEVLIDPRTENPLDYLWLDLETFCFIENADEGSRAWHRASYTIETLRLNRREVLIEARRSAFGSFRARLVEYAERCLAKATSEALMRLRNELRRMHHMTVFAEMQRQHQHYADLAELFALVPEALRWKVLHWEGAR